MRPVGVALSVVLGLAVAVAAIAVHRSLPGLLLGVGTTLVVLWTLRLWLPAAAAGFAAGWLVALVAAVAGRGEGDYVVSSDSRGWMLIGSGFAVLVTGILLARAPAVPHDSGSGGSST